MDCIKCDHWNQTNNFCRDTTKWVDPETGDRVCRFREGAVAEYSSEYFEEVKPKLRKIQHSLNWLELGCNLPEECFDKVNECINDLSSIIADMSDRQKELVEA